MAKEKIVIFHHDERGAVRTWDEVGEIVRCKDCKWKTVTMLKENYCLKYEDIKEDDYFCADGERSEE